MRKRREKKRVGKNIRGQCSETNNETKNVKTHTFFRRAVLENLFKHFFQRTEEREKAGRMNRNFFPYIIMKPSQKQFVAMKK